MSTLAEKRQQVVAEIATLEATLKKMEAQAATDLQTIAADEITGVITSKVAAEKRATIEGETAAKRRKVATLRAAVPALDERIAEEEATELRRKQAGAARGLGHALQARDSAIKVLSRELKSAAASGREVDRHRTFVTEAAAAFRELLCGEEFVWPSNPDESFEVPEDSEWMLAEACRQPRRWSESTPQADQMMIGVNLSPPACRSGPRRGRRRRPRVDGTRAGQPVPRDHRERRAQRSIGRRRSPLAEISGSPSPSTTSERGTRRSAPCTTTRSTSSRSTAPSSIVSATSPRPDVRAVAPARYMIRVDEGALRVGIPDHNTREEEVDRLLTGTRDSNRRRAMYPLCAAAPRNPAHRRSPPGSGDL